eukprot:3944292-Amphidinium_carterae.2
MVDAQLLLKHVAESSPKDWSYAATLCNHGRLTIHNCDLLNLLMHSSSSPKGSSTDQDKFAAILVESIVLFRVGY